MPDITGVTKNLAVGKPTKQSSNSHSLVSSKAVDGSRANNPWTLCSRASSTTLAWWQVDLEAVYEISEVVITNLRDDGCELYWFFLLCHKTTKLSLK